MSKQTGLPENTHAGADLQEFEVVTETTSCTVKRTYIVKAESQEEAEDIVMGIASPHEPTLLLETESDDYDGEEIA